MAPRSAPKSKIVTLQVSSESLSRFSSNTSTPSGSNIKDDPAASESNTGAPTDTLKPTESASNAPSAADSPAPGNGKDGMAPPGQAGKRKGVPGPKPGSKRGAGATEKEKENEVKVRGKPGPKKKIKLDPNDPTATAEAIAAAAAAGPKLGPKANAGAINEKLRALDRSGKPTRKWIRQPFSIKSFTGSVWHVPAYRPVGESQAKQLKAAISVAGDPSLRFDGIDDERRGSLAGSDAGLTGSQAVGTPAAA